MKAKQIRERDGYTTFKMTPPYMGNEYVIMYGATTIKGPMVFTWPADETGHIKDIFELPCSVEGTDKLTAAIAKAGYSLEF